MKKIYKIKSLAVVACALMANVAFGQNLKLTSNGNAVANGDVIDLPYELEVDDYPEMGMTFYSAKWDPHLEVSTVEGTATMSLTVTSIDNATGFTACWPLQCKVIEPNGSLTTEGEITTTPTDLQIHKEVLDLASKDDVPTEGGTIKVTLVSGSESMEITINAILENKNGVGENIADSNVPTIYYTLEGIQVENPTKGIYVARKGGKSKLIYKK